MPPPPDSSILTRYVLENPWPAGLVLLIAASGFLWSGLREGLRPRLRIGAGLGLGGAAIMIVGLLVVTSGERAAAVTRQLVDAVVAKDSVLATSLFAPAASMSFASPANPGFDMTFIIERLDRLSARYTVDSNSITGLGAHTESATAGVVHLGCLTSVTQFPGYSVTQWVVRVERQADGSWKISRLTWISLNGEKPGPDSI